MTIQIGLSKITQEFIRVYKAKLIEILGDDSFIIKLKLDPYEPEEFMVNIYIKSFFHSKLILTSLCYSEDISVLKESDGSNSGVAKLPIRYRIKHDLCSYPSEETILIDANNSTNTVNNMKKFLKDTVIQILNVNPDLYKKLSNPLAIFTKGESIYYE